MLARGTAGRNCSYPVILTRAHYLIASLYRLLLYTWLQSKAREERRSYTTTSTVRDLLTVIDVLGHMTLKSGTRAAMISPYQYRDLLITHRPTIMPKGMSCFLKIKLCAFPVFCLTKLFFYFHLC